MPLGQLVAIMPGRDPLRLSLEFERLVELYHHQHGELPALVLLPRPLGPKEALSWTAYLTRADSFDASQPNTLADPGIPKNRAETGSPKRAKTPSGPKSGVRHHPGREGRPFATTPGVDQEICQLSEEGLGVQAIAGVLAEKGIMVSPRTVARRLACQQSGR